MMEKLASAHRVQRMCQAFQVSRSGYYKYLNQGKEGKRNKENIILLVQILNIWLQSRRVYGSPRIKTALTDRKSTRLNSSHANISYAVFCLKKLINRALWPRAMTPLRVVLTPHELCVAS